MRLVWQIVRKDLWRQRWWISLWLLSGSTMLLTRTAELVIQHGQTVRGMGGGDMFGLWALLTFGLVAFFMPARAVLDDPLVDSNAQWRTRPISMGRLLAAKIVFIVGLMVILPVAILVIGQSIHWALWNRRFFSVLDIACLAEILLTLGMLSGGAAACSRNLTQCLPALPVGWFLFVVWFGGGLRTNFRGSIGPGPSEALLWIGSIAGLVATAGMLNQYLTRRTALTVALLLVASFSPLVLSAYWRWLPFG